MIRRVWTSGAPASSQDAANVMATATPTQTALETSGVFSAIALNRCLAAAVRAEEVSDLLWLFVSTFLFANLLLTKIVFATPHLISFAIEWDYCYAP